VRVLQGCKYCSTYFLNESGAVVQRVGLAITMPPKSMNFENLPLRGWFCPQTAIFASFWPVSVLHGYRWQVTFLDFARPSIY